MSLRKGIGFCQQSETRWKHLVLIYKKAAKVIETAYNTLEISH